MQLNTPGERSIIKNYLGYILIFLASILFIITVRRAFYDVPWMDQVNLFFNKIPELYYGDVNAKTAVYEHEYQLFPTIILANYVNAKLFGLNNKIFIGLVMLVVITTAFLFYKRYNHLFQGWHKLVYSGILALFIFNPIRWEALLPSDFGFFLLLYSLINISLFYYVHQYYFKQTVSRKENITFFCTLILVSLYNTIDNAGYFLPYACASVILSILNYFAFKDEITKKRWWQTVAITVFFILFSIVFNNYIHNKVYGPSNGPGFSEGFLKLLFKEPGYIIKYFLISNTGNFLTYESYENKGLLKSAVPLFGLIALYLYGVSIYLYIKNRQRQHLFFILLILVTLSYYFFILVARCANNYGKIYFGASSRYGATTIFGMVGVCSSLSLFIFNNKIRNKLLKYSSLFGALVLVAFGIRSFKTQYDIAPYREASLFNMTLALKKNENLGILQAHSLEKASGARSFMLTNNLGVFRHGDKLTTYELNAKNLEQLYFEGIYGEETQNNNMRWTNGQSDIMLPNLYATSDSFSLTLNCYAPNADTPRIIFNDNITPASVSKTDNGYKYALKVPGPTVLFRLRLINNTFIPAEKDSTNPDSRRLGFSFSGLKIESQ